MGVVQPSGNLEFAREPVGPERGGHLGAEDFEGNLAAMLQVPGQIHGRHPPATELPLDRVSVGQGRPELSERLRHQDHFPEDPMRDSTRPWPGAGRIWDPLGGCRTVGPL